MKPSFPLIFFTVLAGAGFGAFILLVLFNTLSALDLTMEAHEILNGGLASLVLSMTGLLCANFYLANPNHGWKALNRRRASWLSREAVFALLYFPLATIFLAGFHLYGGRMWWSDVSGWLAVVAGLAAVFSIGRVFASLKTLRQWHNPLVPANYLLICMVSGGALLTSIRAPGGNDFLTIAIFAAVLSFIAVMIKAIYFFWAGDPSRPEIETAIGATHAKVRQMNSGYSKGIFLKQSLGHYLTRPRSVWLRVTLFLFLYLLPGIFLMAAIAGAGITHALAAIAIMFPGLLLERWLFFAETQHIAKLYHGRLHS